MVLSPSAHAANPTTVSFQGKVVNGNGTNVTDGTYSFVFKLYSAGSGGTALWTETDSLSVSAGIFQVNLGSGCSFFVANACNNNTPIDFSASNSLYLGMTFNSDPNGEMSPRMQFQSVPYAWYADNAGSLGGRAASGYVQLSPASQQNGSINVSQNSTFGANIIVGGSISGGTTYSGSGNINTTGGALQTNSVNRIDNSGNLLNVGNVTYSGSTVEALGAANATWQLQNSNGVPLLYVNSATVNLLSNPGFEGGTTGWTTGTTATISQDSSNYYYGLASLKAQTTAANQIVRVSNFTQAITNTSGSAVSYTFSFYAYSAASFSTINISWNNGSADQTDVCTGLTVTTGWSRLSCTISVPNGSGISSVYLKDTGSGHTFWIDSAQLEKNTAATAYNIGSIQLRGIVGNPVTFANSTNSNQAFQIMNTAGTTLLGVDTTNSRLYSGVQDSATAVAFKLDTSNTFATIGGRLLSVRNNGTDKFSIGKDGDLIGAGFDYFDPSKLTGATTTVGTGSAPGGNFGGVFSSGAFIDNTDYYGQDFVGSKASTTTNNTAFGDDGKWFYNNAACTLKCVAAQDFSTTGGYLRLTTANGNGTGALVAQGATAGTLDTPLSAANLPIVQMKVRPGTLVATDDVVFGMMDTAAAPVTNDTLPTNGIFFWTNNSTGTTGWQGVVRSGGATVGTAVSCPGNVTTNFATGRIVVVNATTVRFFMDTDATNGVNLVDCGTVTGTLPTAAMAMGMYDVHTSTATVNIDLDYARYWQDDAAVTGPAAPAVLSSEQTQANLATGADSPGTPDALAGSTVTDTSSVAPTTASSPSMNAPLAPLVSSNSEPQPGTTAQFVSLDSSGNLNLGTGMARFSLNPSGDATLSGNLNLGSALVNGGLSVNGDTTLSGLSTFQKLATFLAKTVFKQDIQVQGHITVGSDSAGYADLRKGEQQVHVQFAKAYDTTPIVSLTSNQGTFETASASHVTPDGFDVVLAAPAPEDVELAWTAWGTDSPAHSQNPLPGLTAGAPN